jgi:hypothetical protein
MTKQLTKEQGIIITERDWFWYIGGFIFGMLGMWIIIKFLGFPI